MFFPQLTQLPIPKENHDHLLDIPRQDAWEQPQAHLFLELFVFMVLPNPVTFPPLGFALYLSSLVTAILIFLGLE